MKKTMLFFMLLLAFVACKQNDPQQPDTPTDDDQNTTSFTIALSYDSVANTVTSIPSDTAADYVLLVWMVQDYIADYGDDFSDDKVFENMNSYIRQCIMYQMGFPLFYGCETVDVYDFFDQPYPGEDCIAMAAPFDTEKRKLLKPVSYIFFTSPKK